MDLNSRLLRGLEGLTGLLPALFLLPAAFEGLIFGLAAGWVGMALVGAGGLLGTAGLFVMLTDVRRYLLAGNFKRRSPVLILLIAGCVSLVSLHFPYLDKNGFGALLHSKGLIYLGPLVVGAWQIGFLLFGEASGNNKTMSNTPPDQD